MHEQCSLAKQVQAYQVEHFSSVTYFKPTHSIFSEHWEEAGEKILYYLQNNLIEKIRSVDGTVKT